MGDTIIMETDSRWPALASIVLVVGVLLLPARADAAGGAFVVDDAVIDDPGKCTGQFWTSAASNHDFIAVAYPTCVVNLGTPVELGALMQRARSADVWSSSGTFTAKTNFIKADKNPFGVGLAAGVTWDLISGANTGGYVYVPVTVPVNDKVKINVNGGWQYDNVAKISYATWGAGVEWILDKDKKLTLLGEVFGQAGALPAVNPGDPPSPNSIIEPRTQIGVRFAPNEKFDIDLIWGHNITGENAQWVTLGLNVRFDLGR